MGKLNRERNQFTPKAGKSIGLLPTPPISTMMNRQTGRVNLASSPSADGDAGNGNSGWRTYAQAKNSEAFFKKRHNSSNASNSKGYRQNTTYQQRERTPKQEKTNDEAKGPSSSSPGGSTDDKDIEIIAHVRRNSDWNQRQHRERVVKPTGPPYDPFHPIALAPPPTQNHVAKMYEDMLNNAVAENSSSAVKGLRTAGDTVRFADEHSSGFFVKTGSKFGNSVMPVLPRL